LAVAKGPAPGGKVAGENANFCYKWIGHEDVSLLGYQLGEGKMP
jgi:hypothetical protein